MKKFILSAIIGLIFGMLGAMIILKINETSVNFRIRDFYLTENAVHVSPHSIRKSIAKGDTNFVLVDLRSAQEYEKEHVVGAVNIPAYSDPDTSAYGDVDRIVKTFEALPQDKDIIVYCYSVPCMTGRKIGKMLAEHDIYVKHLEIGWYEWRYFWNLWNHEHEWKEADVKEYIAIGSEPGIFKGKPLTPSPCSLDNQLGC